MMTTTTADPMAHADMGVESRRAEFNEKFAAALTVFGENLAAWQRGWSWEQTCEMRRLCAEHAVVFDPRHYPMTDARMMTGWVGGPDRARPRAAGGTVYVGVTGDGEVFGIPGRMRSRAATRSSGNDGRSR
jgi:hypothetical protein